MDAASFILFFFVVVPFIVMNLHNQRRLTRELLAAQKETNRLLAEITGRPESDP